MNHPTIVAASDAHALGARPSVQAAVLVQLNPAEGRNGNRKPARFLIIRLQMGFPVCGPIEALFVRESSGFPAESLSKFSFVPRLGAFPPTACALRQAQGNTLWRPLRLDALSSRRFAAPFL